jgi:hypothetical protein
MREAVLYARDGASTAAPQTAADYSSRFARLLRLVDSRKDAIVFVAFPAVLGDSYDEILQSLSLLAEQGLHLAITAPQPGADPLDALQRQRRKRRTQR